MPQRPVPLMERLFANLTPDGECQVWTRATDAHGYGKITEFRDGRWRWLGTHRVMWEHHHGSVPPGMRVLHTCDNPPCCNPAHLFLGTARDNTQDMLAKGRGRWQRYADVS